MNKVIVEKEIAVPVAPVERDGTASNAIWAVALIIIVGVIVGALYYSGALRRLTSPQQPQKINVEVQAPPAQQQPAQQPAPPPANH
jgi:hypothetical protein